MKTILISGGTSYLGQMLINYLSSDYFLTVLVRDEKKFSIIEENAQFEIINISNKKNLSALNNKKYDIYINLISDSSKVRNISSAIKSINSNFFLNHKLLKKVISSNVKKVIQVNTYWQLLRGLDRRKFLIYTLGKRLISIYLKFKSRKNQPYVAYLYLGDVYGEKDFRDKLIPKLLENINLELKNQKAIYYPNNINDVLVSIENNIKSPETIGHYVLFNEAIKVSDIAKIIKNFNNGKNISIKKYSIQEHLQISENMIINENFKSFESQIKKEWF